MSETGIDYAAAGIWERLRDLFETHAQPRATQRSWGRVECEPSWYWRPRPLPDFDAWFPVKGSGEIRIQGRTHRIDGATLYLLRPGDEVEARHDPRDPLTVIFVHFDFFRPGSRESVAVPPDCLPSRAIPLSDPARLDVQLTQVVRLLRSDVRLDRIEANHLLARVLIEAYYQDARNQGRDPSQRDPRIARVIEHVRTRPSQRLSLEEAARLAGLSPSYFSRAFSRQTGESFRRFQLQVRMERAHQLLQETGMSVGDVAAALGYGDLFLFSRQFRQVFGMPPSHARRL